MLVTDHKPLISSQFTTSIKHLPGVSNIVADALSRPEAAVIHAPITVQNIVEAQRTDDEVEQLRKNGFGKQLFQDKIIDNETTFCNIFNGVSKPVIPKLLRFPLFSQIHGIAHPGVKATIRLIRARY